MNNTNNEVSAEKLHAFFNNKDSSARTYIGNILYQTTYGEENNTYNLIGEIIGTHAAEQLLAKNDVTNLTGEINVIGKKLGQFFTIIPPECVLFVMNHFIRTLEESKNSFTVSITKNNKETFVIPNSLKEDLAYAITQIPETSSDTIHSVIQAITDYDRPFNKKQNKVNVTAFREKMLTPDNNQGNNNKIR